MSDFDPDLQPCVSHLRIDFVNQNKNHLNVHMFNNKKMINHVSPNC